MELYQLRSFAAVARAGNLSRAARELCASQPAVSAQIKALEEELGVPLFERTPRGMDLTSAGTSLLGKAGAVLDAALDLAAEARRLSGDPEGTLRIGALSDPAILRLARILSLLQRRHPALAVELRHATSGVVREELLAGKLDAGLVLGPSEPELERRELRPMSLVVVLPPGTATDLPWGKVADLQWIGTPAGCPFQILSRRLFERAGGAPGRIFEVEIERTIVEMVAAGMGAGLVREDTAAWALGRGKCAVWEGEGVRTSLALVWRRERSSDPAVRALRAIVDEAWAPEEADART